MLAWISKPCDSTSCSCPSLSPQRGPQIRFPRPIHPGESPQTWTTSPSLQPFHRDIGPALRRASTRASLWAPAEMSARGASASHLPQAQGMQALCWAGTRPGRNQIWAAPEPKITCQLPGKRGEPSAHRSRTCQEGSHLHPSSGITGGSMVFGAIQWITAEQWRKTASRSFWAAEQQTANTPRAPSSIWGRAAVPGSRRARQCSCVEEQRPLLGPSSPPPRGSNSSNQSCWEPGELANSC